MKVFLYYGPSTKIVYISHKRVKHGEYADVYAINLRGMCFNRELQGFARHKRDWIKAKISKKKYAKLMVEVADKKSRDDSKKKGLKLREYFLEKIGC